MKLPQPLEQTDELVAKLVASHRTADVPKAPMEALLAKIDRGNIPVPDVAGLSTRAFRPVFGTKSWIVGAVGAAVLSGAAFVTLTARTSSTSSPSLPSASSPASVASPSSPSSTKAPDPRVTEPRVPDPRAADPRDDQPASIPSLSVDTLPSVVEPSPSVASPAFAATSPRTHGAAHRDPRSDAPPATPPAGLPASAPATSAATTPPTSAPASSLRRELELVETARRALRAGDGAACLASVDRYESEFPSGQFAAEARVMRIEASAVLGRRDDAETLARAFLNAHPKSAYAERVRSVLARVAP